MSANILFDEKRERERETIELSLKICLLSPVQILVITLFIIILAGDMWNPGPHFQKFLQARATFYRKPEFVRVGNFLIPMSANKE